MLNHEKPANYTQEISVNGMTVRTSKTAPKVGEIFYVSSESQPESEYVVRARKRYPTSTDLSGVFDLICSCPDFFFNEWARNRTCKHEDSVLLLVTLVGSTDALAQKLRSL